jgi:large subunit ribosomal protein L9
MKVIIKETGEIKDVSFGYAVNYLIPQGKAVIATKKALNLLEKKKDVLLAKKKADQKQDVQLAKKLNNKKVVIKAKVSKDDQIFGSISKRKILDALKVNPEKATVILAKPIKKLGSYSIKLKIGQEEAEINVKVKKES